MERVQSGQIERRFALQLAQGFDGRFALARSRSNRCAVSRHQPLRLASVATSSAVLASCNCGGAGRLNRRARRDRSDRVPDYAD